MAKTRYNTEHLAVLKRELERIEGQMTSAAIRAREQGATWQQIGNELGISKQRAQQKYSVPNKDEQPYPGSDQLIFGEDLGADVAEAANALAALTAVAAEQEAAEQPAKVSIFSDTPSPAKAKKAPSKRWEAKTYHRLTWYGVEPTGPAEPGTGKGPHACPSCEQTNHKTTTRDICQFGKSCTPTRYDTPEITACMVDTFTALNEAKKGSK